MNDLKIIQEKIYEIRGQLDAISMALAELQSKETVKKERKPIGFIQHWLHKVVFTPQYLNVQSG